ncbi:MAG: hypothetical protein M1820_000603 [Bogoriella megaspora]|nr:MAG: hypothetical protein M1820_000603 [Bogoriella megaspora]
MLLHIGTRFHAPHHRALFEGWYSKFSLPSGASFIIVVCSVPNAEKKPHQLSFTYVPADSKNVIQHQLWVDDIQRISHGGDGAFVIRVPQTGSVSCLASGLTIYDFEHPNCKFYAETTSRKPWSGFPPTPEGLLVFLPFPVHWHVHSLGSPARFSLDLPNNEAIPAEDRSGTAIVHEEKNWAHSFPSAHMWVQAWDPSTSRGLCLAGGKILGLEAYLLGYRDPKRNVDIAFRPPFALSAMGMAPFMSVKRDWQNRSLELWISGLRHRIHVKAQAPKDTFFPLSAPFADGHRENFLVQSMATSVDVTAWKRRGWLWFFGIGVWEKVSEEHFHNASLEFGGDYYPLATT